MVRAVLVTHGELGRELVRTVESIVGPQEEVHFVSNAGASLETLVARVREVIGENGGPAVLFVDLLGGSCGHACRALLAQETASAVVSGVNLPMLLDFFCNRGRVPFDELKQRILQKGRDGVQVL